MRRYVWLDDDYWDDFEGCTAWTWSWERGDHRCGRRTDPRSDPCLCGEYLCTYHFEEHACPVLEAAEDSLYARIDTVVAPLYEATVSTETLGSIVEQLQEIAKDTGLPGERRRMTPTEFRALVIDWFGEVVPEWCWSAMEVEDGKAHSQSQDQHERQNDAQHI